jgi:hypothetical protein
MSRGLGRVERAVLEALDGYAPQRHRMLSADLVHRLYGAEPSEAQRVALRRAVRSLRRKELVTTRQVTFPVGKRSCGCDRHLAMLDISPTEAAAEALTPRPAARKHRKPTARMLHSDAQLWSLMKDTHPDLDRMVIEGTMTPGEALAARLAEMR